MKENVAYIVSMVNGLEAFIHREINNLLELGITIELFITTYKNDPIYGPKNAGWIYHYLHTKTILAVFLHLIKSSFSMPNVLVEAIKYHALQEYIVACYFSSIMKRRDIKHIHCHFGDKKLLVGYFCSKLTNIDLSVTIHSHEIHKNPNPDLFRIALKRCKRIFPISDYARRKLIDVYNAPSNTTITNRLFVELDKYKTNPDLITVLTVGRFDERKGHQFILESANILRNKNIKFIIIGFGPMDIKKMVSEMGLQDKVILFNKMSQEQLVFFYNTADIFCLPSVALHGQGPEGIPVVLMEAMAAGLPVITTATGGTTELVKEIIVPQANSQQLAKEIMRLASNPELRRQQGKENRKMIKEGYSSKNLSKLIELFKSRI